MVVGMGLTVEVKDSKDSSGPGEEPLIPCDKASTALNFARNCLVMHISARTMKKLPGFHCEDDRF